MKKILSSVLVVGVVAIAVGIGSRAFFSDTETSVGNTLAAGAIDLKIDNTSYYTDPETGVLAASTATSWTLADLTVEKFFNFLDLKPGDVGEDTISIHVNDNDAWVCAAARVTVNSDETCTEPENTDETGACVVETDGTNGDLAQQVNFSFWKDDGDNVLEVGETPFLSGPISSLNGVGQIALADTTTDSVFGQGVPVPGGSDTFVGKAWCFGTLTPAPLPQDGLTTGTPLTLGTGFICDGSALNNIAQTDKVVGDLQFYAVQSRNNAEFSCAEDYQPLWSDGETQGPVVGALLSAYVAPTCDVTVTTTIQAAIDSAVAGQTVCVPAGTYNEDVNVNKDITLAGAGSVSTNIVGQTSGEAGAVVITADGATVQGFNVTEAAGGVAAIRISGAHTGITINSNKATGGGNAFLTDGGQSNHVISNNEFVGTAANPIAYVNGTASVAVASDNVDFLNNTFSGTGTMALGMEATNGDIDLNKFSATTSFTDVETWTNSNTVNQNNFNDSGLMVQHSGAGTLDAENNWWVDNDPSDNVGGTVDYTPFEASAFAEN